MVDISFGGGAARADALAGLPSRLRQSVVWALVGAAMMLTLLAPAIWNGFPIIFPDTGGYLDRPILGTLGMGRSALYGAFLYLGISSAFWLNVIVQSAMIGWLIVLTLRSHGLGDRPFLALGIVTVLTVTTSMPWFTAQLMPDVLFAAAALALHLLLFRDALLKTWERWTLAAIIVVSMPSHMAAAGLCVGIVAAVALLRLLPRLPLPVARLNVAAAAVAAGLVLCPLSNFAITGQFALTPGGSSFLVGRLVEDGIVIRYLNDKCPDPAMRLCAFTADFPTDADGWLWDGKSPFRKLRDFEGSAEEKALAVETLKAYPFMHLTAALNATLQQLTMFKTEITSANTEPTVAMFKDHLPEIMPAFMAARQQAQPYDVEPINALHGPVAILGMACLVAGLLFRRRLGLPPEMAALAVTVLLALTANAAICGIFSHAVDRYQSRLVWLAVLVALMMAACLARAAAARRVNPSGNSAVHSAV